MTFSWDRAWGDVVAMMRAHAEILLVVAGLFIFLPAFVIELYVKPPVGGGATVTEAARILNVYLVSNWLPLLIAAVITRMGEATVLAVLLNPRRQTVSQSLRVAAAALFPFVVLNLITSFAVVAGLLALIVPGIYLFGRLAVAAPAMLAERDLNPMNAIARSFALSRNAGWGIAGLIVLVFVVATIVTHAIKAVVTVALVFVIPRAAITEVTALVSALLDASVSVVVVVLVAAIYRQLVAASRQLKETFS